MSSNTSDNEVFEYMGNGHVPRDVVSVVFHTSVTDVAFREINDKAFYNCSDLREVILNEGLVKIGYMSFMLCRSIQRVTFPSTVTEIDVQAFDSCVRLREVVLNEGLQKIEWYAFKDCKSLERISIPSTVTDIGHHAFWFCGSLREVVLNEGLEKIRNNAFDCCGSLQSITIPSSVIEIGERAFRECSNLREVVCGEGLPKIKYDTFDNCPTLERITFPNLSTRLDNIIQAGQVDVQNNVQQFMNRGEIEWERSGTICILVDVTRRRTGWALVQQHFHRIVNWIKYYEMKEATTLFELALWKARIDQVDDTTPFDRDTCRVDVPGPVKVAILQYLL